MPLAKVTISGADDDVNPLDLVGLSKRFPFVEWGILFSEKRTGEPRYPTLSWIEKIEGLTLSNKINLSLHLCGKAARDTISGNDCWIGSFAVLKRFRRYQINGNFPIFSSDLNGFVKLVRKYSATNFILQAKDDPAIEWCGSIKYDLKLPNISALFDGSGGRGIEPFSWPFMPYGLNFPNTISTFNGLNMGFAGGISPENVLDVLKDIGPRSHCFWIDMESGVRTNNKFDLEKVSDILNKVSEFVVYEK